MKNGWITLTLMDTIECEKRYPGLLDDCFTWIWQDGLIEKQLNDEKNGDALS